MTATGREFLEYGCNTCCISVDWGGGLAVLDAGSGLANLGAALENSRSGQEPKSIHLLFSHLHMDHIIGLFGLGLLHDPQTLFHFYGDAGSGASFRQQLGQILGRPYWPLGLDDYQAQIQIHEVRPGQQFCLEETGTALRVSTLRGMHPGGSILYRLDQTPSSGSARSLVYALDCELDKAMSRELAAFASGTDLLVCDAHFTEEDLRTHQGWGHSSWQQGMALRQASGAARGVMMHFSPGYTDAFLRQQETELRALDGNCCFAKEGMEIRI